MFPYSGADDELEHNSLPVIPKLLPKLISILFKLQQDPTTIVSLSIKLIKPLSFTDILSFSNEDSLILALQSPSPAANKLALHVIGKASNTTSSVALLSVMKNLVTQLIRTWLSTPDVGVADLAGAIILTGLKNDCEHPVPIRKDSGEWEIHAEPGQGLLWRRIFFDKDILDTVFNLCSHFSPLDSRQKSLAQSRLSAIAPQLAQVNFALVSNATLPEVESRYGSKSFLDFVALRMIDSIGEDELMRITNYRFWYELFTDMSKVECTPTITRKLAELVVEGMELDGNLEPFLKSGVFHVADDPADVEHMMQLLGKLELGLEKQGEDVEMDG